MLETLVYKLMGRRPPVVLQRSAKAELRVGDYGFYSHQQRLALKDLPQMDPVTWLLLEPDNATALQSTTGLVAVLLDCRQIQQVDELQRLLVLVQQLLPVLQNQSPILLLSDSQAAISASHSACQSALTGFVRSLAKELGNKACRVNLLDLSGADWPAAHASVQFFLSPASAYISGQVLKLGEVAQVPMQCAARPLAGKTALVTGAARGIGKAIASQLAAEGALVVGLDLPAAAPALDAVMQSLRGQSIALDLTGAEAPAQLLAQLQERHLSLDLVVHNAGVTRDKTLKNMALADWQLVLELNLNAQIRLNEALLGSAQLAATASFVSLSSINGLAGQRGQCNYASAKSALSGYIQHMARTYPMHRFNAVAPGFIRTEMTEKMPWLIREIGQRFNSLGQAGEPSDVAHAVCFLVRPDNKACNAQVLRVCGQSLVGA
ncbi:3-oxoacyl-ACP reductase [Rheinheimera sp.]|uniref:3-oxoacyl-ACP reductase n=1 Tax=Rheinheimera sp. TaxID=1869214 RepID=UPI00307E0E58